MPDDRFPPNPDRDDAALATALRALPLRSPRAGGFAALSRELALATPRPDRAFGTRRVAAAWLALAATLFAAIVGVRVLHPEPVVGMREASASTRELIEQSQQLDAILAACRSTLPARWPASSSRT